jgi:hypothetical protein
MDFDRVRKQDISVYLGVIPNRFCDKLIREFHKGFAFGEVIEGHVSAEGVDEYRSDNFLRSKDVHLYDHERWDDMNIELHSEYILPCLDNYLSDYQYVLREHSEVDPKSCIMSLYERDKGFFCPHQDSIGGLVPQRSLTIICYLNDVLYGGSTHFFNQKYRISPGVGNIAIFPSNFIYGHIGEPPKSGDKYITVSFASIDVGDEHKVKAIEGR